MSGVTAYPACGACHQAPKVSLPPFACPFEGRTQVVADADGGRVRPPGAGHDSQLRPHTVPRLRATSSGCAQVCGNERQPGACRVPGMHGGGHSTQPQMLRPADRHRQPRAPAHDGDDAGATMLPNAASPSAVVRGLVVLLHHRPMGPSSVNRDARRCTAGAYSTAVFGPHGPHRGHARHRLSQGPRGSARRGWRPTFRPQVKLARRNCRQRCSRRWL